MKRILTGEEFGKSLVECGIIDEFTGDIIIEVPVAGVVIIHMAKFTDEAILKALPAKVKPAQLVKRKRAKRSKR